MESLVVWNITDYVWKVWSFEISLIMFGMFGHLNDGCQSCLSQPDPEEFINLQWFSVSTLKTGSMTSWCLGDFNLQRPRKNVWFDFLMQNLKIYVMRSRILILIKSKSEQSLKQDCYPYQKTNRSKFHLKKAFIEGVTD